VLVKPVKRYRDAITSMGKGIIPDQEFREGNDEMGQIGKALNNMIKGLRDLSVFAEEIGKGNFSSDFTPQSDDDILGNSLIRLREDLRNAASEEEKRKREDERRNWSNHGIARFSEILREFSGNTAALAKKLTSELVTYLDARVGGIFLIRKGDSGEDEIELIASYAYDRSKHLKKRIQFGEGLVGRCIQEGSTIFLTDIPDDYIKIKSGLGDHKPQSLLIVPIRLNEQIIGVIEIATLEVFRDFQIDFVERIGSTIASSLAGDH
jgi:putative methionine-R-sulfoxide reductase with GAF domain